MAHGDALQNFIKGQNSKPEIIPPTTAPGGQDARPAEILAGGPSAKSSPILAPSNLQVSEKKPAKFLDALKSKSYDVVPYDPIFAENMYLWFVNKPKYRTVIETAYWKNGEERTKERQVPNPPPHFSEFAREIGVTEKILKKWAKAYPEFAESYEACSAIIKEFLIDNGLLKNYDPTFAKFAATYLTDMRDKTEVLKRTVDLNKILDKAEKSHNPFDDVDV